MLELHIKLYSVLSEFRSRLIDGETEHLLFETMLTRFVEKGLLKAKGKQRTDSTHILAAIRTLTRLELVTETLTHTLNVLATLAPDWLKSWVEADWFTKYERQLDEYRLGRIEHMGEAPKRPRISPIRTLKPMKYMPFWAKFDALETNNCRLP